VERSAPGSEADGLLKKLFYGIAVLGLLLMLGLSAGVGINADDKFQVDYSQKLVNYYSSFGRDTSALNVPDGNMHLYGGFFEVVTGFTSKALGYTQLQQGYHNIRHGFSAILGWIAILCAGLLARRIAGWRAGLFTLLILLLSPRFLGDSLVNPKDIPFAAGYMMALYNMVMVLDTMPRPKRWHLAGLAGGLAIALAMRAGGLLPFAILFLFAGLHFILRNGGFAAFTNGRRLLRYAAVVLGVAAAGYVLALLFWPYALQNPLKNPFIALSKFAALEVRIRVLFEGLNQMSDKTPWYYPVKWMALTLPLVALVGMAGSVLLLPRLLRHYAPLWISLVFFAGVFPVFYVIYKNSVIHDGWRHLTFAYPPLAVAAGLFWNELAGLFASRKPLQYAVYGLFALLGIEAAWFTASNPHLAYTYFNPIAGGVKGAYGKYETDYWGISVRQGLEWMEQQGILRPDLTEPVIIATNMYYPVSRYVAKYGDKVKVKYLKWEKRCDDAWDYGIYPTRFLDGSTLRKGFWPNDNTVHTVTAGGAPVLAVMKDNGRNCTLGTASLKLNDWAGAIERLRAEVANVPDNELAWASLSQAYLGANMLEEAKAAAEKSLEISPDDSQANNLLGMYWMNKGDQAKAKAQFDVAIRRDPENAAAWYYLATIAARQDNYQAALANLQKCIDLAPTFKQAYELAAQIYEATGDTERAQQIRNLIK
jgi:tetratricopeptide (TPR) repeat protein